MKRVVLLSILLGVMVLTAPAAADDKSGVCSEPINNTTVQGLCDRVERLQKAKSEVRAEKTSLLGKISNLRYKVNHSQSIRSLAKGKGFIYKDGEPQVLLLRLEKDDAQQVDKKFGIFQKCTPRSMDKAGYDFDNDGDKEYCKVPVEQINQNNALSPVKITLYYSERGLNTTYVLEQGDAVSRLKEIRDEMNDQGGVLAYDRWKSTRLYRATQTSAYSSLGIATGGLFIGVVGTLLGIPVFRKLRKQWKVNRHYSTGARSTKTTWTQRAKHFLDKFRR